MLNARACQACIWCVPSQSTEEWRTLDLPSRLKCKVFYCCVHACSPRASDPVLGAELGRGERLGKPGSLLTIPRQYGGDTSAMAGAAQVAIIATSSGSTAFSSTRQPLECVAPAIPFRSWADSRRLPSFLVI